MSTLEHFRTLKPLVTIPPPAPAPIKGPRPELRWLPISRLVIDDRYQRAIGRQGRPNVVRILENFDWNSVNPGLRFRGPVCIHASSGLTRDEYEDAAASILAICGQHCPPAAALQRGGIVGTVTVSDVIRERDVQGNPKWLSPWFFGPVGLVLRSPLACDFIPVKGALGFFEWTAGDPASVPPPARWMLPADEQPVKRDTGQGTLL